MVRETFAKITTVGLKDSALSLPDWLHSTRANLVARGITREHQQVITAATHLRGQHMRRWDTTVSLMSPTVRDHLSWNAFATTLLSSQEGKHPAEKARLSFTGMKYAPSKSCLQNFLYYSEQYERMLEHCGNSHVSLPASYDLVQHVLSFANSAPVQVTVAVQTVYATQAARLQSAEALNTAHFVSVTYGLAFSEMLKTALTVSRVQDETRNKTLAFGRMGTCYYCGSQDHKAYACKATFGTGSDDKVKARARDLGKKFFSK